MWAPAAEPSDDFDPPEFGYHTCCTTLDDWEPMSHSMHNVSPLVVAAASCIRTGRMPSCLLSRTVPMSMQMWIRLVRKLLRYKLKTRRGGMYRRKKKVEFFSLEL